jgi:hypothetical protein
LFLPQEVLWTKRVGSFCKSEKHCSLPSLWFEKCIKCPKMSHSDAICLTPLKHNFFQTYFTANPFQLHGKVHFVHIFHLWVQSGRVTKLQQMEEGKSHRLDSLQLHLADTSHTRCFNCIAMHQLDGETLRG